MKPYTPDEYDFAVSRAQELGARHADLSQEEELEFDELVKLITHTTSHTPGE